MMDRSRTLPKEAGHAAHCHCPLVDLQPSL